MESIYLMNAQQTILEEIADSRLKQSDIALTYRYLLESDRDKRESIDWGMVNQAILKRWSKSGLKHVKELAWSGKCFNSR
jgi:hypothetical protein